MAVSLTYHISKSPQRIIVNSNEIRDVDSHRYYNYLLLSFDRNQRRWTEKKQQRETQLLLGTHSTII